MTAALARVVWVLALALLLVGSVLAWVGMAGVRWHDRRGEGGSKGRAIPPGTGGGPAL